MSTDEASIRAVKDAAHWENLCRPEVIRNFLDACVSGDIETVTDIVNGNGDPFDLESGLCEAIRTEKLDIARFLLEKGARFSWSERTEAMNRIKWAITESCLALLVEYGWDVNTPDWQGNPILMDVTILTNEFRLKWLLEHGADPNLVPSKFGGSVLDMAAEVGTVPIFKLLLQHGAKLENSFPLHAAAIMGPRDAARLSRALPSEYLSIVGNRIPMMKYLLNIGVDVNGPDDSGNPHHRYGNPLHYAIAQGPPANVRFLLEHGADPNLKDARGKTAFELADEIKDGMDEILKEFSPPN